MKLDPDETAPYPGRAKMAAWPAKVTAAVTTHFNVPYGD